MRVVFTSDWQYPFVDHRAWKLGLSAAKELKPDLLIFGGDILDFDGFSRRFQHTVPAHRRNGRQAIEECRAAGDMMARWVREVGPKRAVCLGGNHEERPQALVREIAPILDGTFSVAEWMELEKHGIEWIPYRNGNGKLHVGGQFRGMTFLHGFAYKGGKSKNAGAAAIAHMGKLDGSVCHGHTNRCVATMERRPNRIIYGIEAGCLCAPEAMADQYNPIPDLQQGIAFVTLKDGVVDHASVIRLDGKTARVPATEL